MVSNFLASPDKAFAETSKLLFNNINHSLAIYLDPPDAAFKEVTLLTGRQVIDPASSDPIVVAIANVGSTVSSQNALGEPCFIPWNATKEPKPPGMVPGHLSMPRRYSTVRYLAGDTRRPSQRSTRRPQHRAYQRSPRSRCGGERFGVSPCTSRIVGVLY